MSAQGMTMNAAFNALDVNNDGVISRAEFAAACGGGSAQMGGSANMGGSVQMVGATMPGTVTYGSPSVAYGATGQTMVTGQQGMP